MPDQQQHYSHPLPKTLYGAGCLLGLLLLPVAHQLFRSAGLRWLHVLAVSFLAAWVITPLVRQLAFAVGALDNPDFRKTHKRPTPLLGGLAIYAAFLLALLTNGIFDHATRMILLAASSLLVIGVIDDVKPLPAVLKLTVQCAAAWLVFQADVAIHLLPRNGVSPELRLFSISGNAILTFLWLIGITNAMNFLDGMDGLATGLTAVIAFFLGLAALQGDQPQLAWFALAMLGAGLGFLPYNFRANGRPAHIFLGDAGSTFMGFTLACLGIRGDWAQGNHLVSACTPILLFGVLIFDMTHTTISRIWTGKVRSFRDWVDYVGQDHIHHRLNRLFQCRKKAVLFILAISGGLGINALVLRHVGSFDAGLLVAQGIIGFLMFSAANFYQERTILKLRRERNGLRVQEFLDITVTRKQDSHPAVLLDISASGAKILVHAAKSVAIGDRITLRARDFEAANASPTGRILWQRPVILDEQQPQDSDYLEYGIEFDSFSDADFLSFITALHQRQIRHRQQMLQPVIAAASCSDGNALPRETTTAPCTATIGI